MLSSGIFFVTTDPAAIKNAKTAVENENLHYVDSVEEVLKNADGCILVTEWDEYKNLSPELFKEQMKTPIIIDGRRIYNYQNFKEKGIVFRGIGLGK